MKQLILLALAVIPFSLFAQNVDKKGNIEYNGEIVGRVEKSGGIPRSYSLYDQNDEEIVSFEPNGKSAPDFRYNVTFLRTDNKGECPGNLAFHKKIAKAFVKSNLVKAGTYQYKRESRFMSSISGGVYLGGNVDIKPMEREETEESLLERDRDAMIQVFGKNVKQDFKNIATFKKSQRATRGTIVVRIKIYNHNGKQIAEATADGVMNTEYKIVTLKDNETHFVKAESSLYIVRDIVKSLVDDYYL
jgi:hypothetical protein